MTAVEIVQEQVEAYNARDLARFVACYGDAITVTRLPETQPSISGKPAFADFYATQRFNRPALRADIVNRIALGNKVIDHERIHGVRDAPFEIVVIYEVGGGLIQRVWSVAPD